VANRTTAAPGRRGALRVRPWELGVGLVLVAAGAYLAGWRAGRDSARSASPHAPAEEAMPPAEAGMPSDSSPEGMSPPTMSLDQMRKNLASVSDVEELVGIANQHLDSARSLEGGSEANRRETRDKRDTRYTIAIAAYERALELRPRDPNLTTDLGIAYRGLGDSEKAIALFRQAAAADPKHVQSRYNLGLVLHDDLDRSDEAKAAWQDYLRVAPKSDPNRQQVEEDLKRF
jgi:tetratricopeptide (TPR) repeat protein